MVVYSLYIINKAGGVIYQQDFQPSQQVRREKDVLRNDPLVLGSTFHSMHAIAARLSPTGNNSGGGIEVIESDTFKLQCFQSHTGVKLYVVADPGQTDTESILAKIYQLYSDFVLKNPFYTIDQPIRCEQFDIELAKFMQSTV